MKVILQVNGIDREFHGDYDELHNRDWNKRVRDLLDYAYEDVMKAHTMEDPNDNHQEEERYEVEQEINVDHYKDNKI